MTTRKRPGFLKAILIGLTVECPQGVDSKACPLHEQRKLPFSDKVKWTQSLAHDELFALYSAHCHCLKIKGAIYPAP